MTAPHDSHPESLDEDPTGMRALLSSLPDPGPMPDDLVERITASLAAEQAGPVLDELAERRRRLPRRPILVAAAAAAVVVAGGTILSSGLPGSIVASVQASGSAGSAAGGSAADADSGADLRAESQNKGTEPPAAVGFDTDNVVVVHTGTAYAAAALAREATTLRDAPAIGDAHVEGTDDAADTGSGVASLAGARACASALGVPQTSTVVVDVATVDHTAAAVLLAEAPDGTSTAYAVGLFCGQDAPDVLAGPVTVP